MSLVSSLVQRVTGAGRRTSRPAGGLAGPGRTGTTGATSSKDAAIGRGVRTVLGRLRRR